MIIPGYIISILTFPGVIVHELAHQLLCYLCGIKVIKIKYFQFDNPSGYVVHEGTDRPGKVFITSMGPFIINTLLGILIILPASIEFFAFKVNTNYLNLFNVWAGFSILMHAFPSSGDAKVMVQQILKNKDVNIIIKIFVAPWIALVYIGAAGSVAWLDAIHATAVAMLIPNLFIKLF